MPFPSLSLTLFFSRYMRTSSYSLAEEFFSKAKAISPEDPLIYNELGVLAFQRKQYAAAVKQLKKALQLMPANPWESTVNNLAHALRKTGQVK